MAVNGIAVEWSGVYRFPRHPRCGEHAHSKSLGAMAKLPRLHAPILPRSWSGDKSDSIFGLNQFPVLERRIRSISGGRFNPGRSSQADTAERQIGEESMGGQAEASLRYASSHRRNKIRCPIQHRDTLLPPDRLVFRCSAGFAASRMAASKSVGHLVSGAFRSATDEAG